MIMMKIIMFMIAAAVDWFSAVLVPKNKDSIGSANHDNRWRRRFMIACCSSLPWVFTTVDCAFFRQRNLLLLLLLLVLKDACTRFQYYYLMYLRLYENNNHFQRGEKKKCINKNKPLICEKNEHCYNHGYHQ